MTLQALPSSGLLLRDLLVGDVRIVGTPHIRAAGCTSHWHHVRPGDVFVAITEADDDGHDHAAQAVQRGAVAVVCERQLPVFDVPQFVVNDSRAAYARLCQGVVGDPSQNLKLIGVAGTHGKTSVARLLVSIFREAGMSVGSLDSFGFRDGGDGDGDDDPPPSSAALSPPVLARSLANMTAAGASHAVVEVSSRALSQAVLSGVTLDAVCITHIGRGSLDWHGSVESYRQAERRIVKHASPDAVAILNADDPVSMQILAELRQPVLTFGLRQAAEITADIIERHVNEQTFVMTAGDDSVGVRTAMIGDHHVSNCLAAATTGLAYGIDLTTIARGLEAVDGLPGRMQRVMCGQDCSVFVDAARSPDALRACLRAARQATAGRLICVFGPPGEDEPVERPLLGRVAGAMADLAIITSACPFGDVRPAVLADVRRGFAAPHTALLVPHRENAIRAALAEARTGDSVVVAGMGDLEYRPTHNDDTLWNDFHVIRHVLLSSPGAAARPRLAA